MSYEEFLVFKRHRFWKIFQQHWLPLFLLFSTSFLAFFLANFFDNFIIHFSYNTSFQVLLTDFSLHVMLSLLLVAALGAVVTPIACQATCPEQEATVTALNVRTSLESQAQTR